MIRKTILIVALAASCCVVMLPAPAGAQRALRAGSVPVTIAVLEWSAHTEGTEAVIVRRPAQHPADVIVIRENALNPAMLSAALRQLLALRSAMGDEPRMAGTFRVRRGVRPGEARQDELFLAPRLVRELRRATPRHVDGVGVARAVEISVPAQNTPPGRT